MLLATASVARAFSFSQPAPTGQTVYYTVISGTSTVRVVNPDWELYDAPVGSLELPATVTNGGTTYAVVSLGIEAFKGCAELTRVVIPEGVTSIGRMAFYGCTALDTILLPSTLTEILSQAFANTAYYRNAANRNDQGMLYIGQWLVHGFTASARPAVASVADGTRGIAAMAFYFDTSLHKLTLPASLQYVSDLAFSDCLALDTMRCLAVIPPQLSENAFEHVSGLTVVVPCGSVDDYIASPLWNVHNVVEDTCAMALDEALQPAGPTVTVAAGGIVLHDADGCRVTVADMMGRRVAVLTARCEQLIALPATGVYLVAVEGCNPLKVCYWK